MEHAFTNEKTLGVIGGLGPMATACFMELLARMTDAKIDQEHLDTLVFSLPSIPDRTAFILDASRSSPLPPIIAAAKKLEALGVYRLAIPCITSHVFMREVQAATRVPFINIVEETVAHLAENGVQKAGLMATTGTVRTALFQKALERRGIAWAVPNEAHQALVMDIIYKNVKAGLPVNRAGLDAVTAHLHAQGAQCVILGCTELSVAKRDAGPTLAFPEKGFLDALAVLARACVLACGKPLAPGFASLLEA